MRWAGPRDEPVDSRCGCMAAALSGRHGLDSPFSHNCLVFMPPLCPNASYRSPRPTTPLFPRPPPPPTFVSHALSHSPFTPPLCPTIHLLLLSLLLFFSQEASADSQKWVLTAQPKIPGPFLSCRRHLFFLFPFLSSQVMLGVQMHPVRGKRVRKKVMIQSVLLCRKDFSSLVVPRPVCRLCGRSAIGMHFLFSFPPFHCSE